MLLCSQGEIQRIISEQTSGTTGAGKRVFYTEGDCEHTIELLWPDLVSLFIREAGLWLPCRFQVLLTGRTDRRRNQTYRSTSPFNREQ